jgi:aryl-phospho-beta-D-glucosidase BglC (GH1 family)
VRHILRKRRHSELACAGRRSDRRFRPCRKQSLFDCPAPRSPIAARIQRLAFSAARLIVTAAVLLTFAIAPSFAQDTSLAHRRAQRLRRGINLSEWFAQVYDPRGYTKEHFETWTTAHDIELIKEMGFDHVRLSVNPQPMFRRNQADNIPPEYLQYLDHAVQMILAQNLAVIIDMHPDSDFKEKLVKDDSFVEQFEDFWRATAKHYANTNSDMVFFEILNEPEFRDRYRWGGVQSRLAMAIREGAPQHTIIAAGANWSSENELLFMEPLHDSNIIYNFHFYDPHIFSHQGATWTTNFQHYLNNLPYPSTPENVQVNAAQVPDAVNRLSVIQYGLDRWNRDRMDALIVQAVAWAKRWNVPLTCNEFGVYRRTADPQARAHWLSDLHTVLEKYEIGWTMWDYSGGFAVVIKTKDQPAAPDETTIKALGLNVPPRASSTPPPGTAKP